MLLLYIFILVMIFSAIPLVGVMTKRASAAATMKRALEKQGCRVIPTRAFWYMGTVDGKKCDLHVYYDGRVISVKTVGFFTKNVILNFIDKTSYSIKELKGGKTYDPDKLRYKIKKKSPYDFSASLPDELSGKKHARVILVFDPFPLKITKTEGGISYDLEVGDETGEGELYTTASFIELFKTAK